MTMLQKILKWGLQARMAIPDIKKASLGRGVGGGMGEGTR